MHVRLLSGPAGSGKTFRCLSEAREALVASPEGRPLLFLAPKQGTYQLEQRLLSTPSLAGYTRLFILSFEALASWIFERLQEPPPRVLSEEGRVMVLRALLAEKRQDLKLFRASARLTGFAQQLSQMLSELQRARLTPASLNQLAAQMPKAAGLSYKLQDLAVLLEHYLGWLAARQLQDQEELLSSAARQLQRFPPGALVFDRLWVDGFAEFSDLELELLGALLPRCARATVTFCLDPPQSRKHSWLSHWSMVQRSFDRCQKRFSELPGTDVIHEALSAAAGQNRFCDNTVLRHLAQCWNEPRPYEGGHADAERSAGGVELAQTLRLACAPDREQEAVVAAREILKWVRAGGRYRDVSVVVRKLDVYQQFIRRVFSRYEIPFFLDRREPVAHHPLAELTRGAVRAVAFGWQHADWFAALKTGLLPVEEEEIDLLENEALARGWTGRVWLEPIRLHDLVKTEPDRERLQQHQKRLEQIRGCIVPPFEKFYLELAGLHSRPSGKELAEALRKLWSGLNVQERLQTWADAEACEWSAGGGRSVHNTVWRQLNAWLDNAELAFPRERLSLREWLSILEAGLAGLSIGVIPPSLDQVLVGAIDRSRTPEVKLALVLGLNESVFPAAPEPAGLLTETDRHELEKHEILLGPSMRRQVGREKYLGYIACTRARQRLVLTWAESDPAGAPLNPSSLVAHLRQLFPGLPTDLANGPTDWQHCEHLSELRAVLPSASLGPARSALTVSPLLPGLESLREGMLNLAEPLGSESLDPELAQDLYGPVLRSSVSRLEQFAACPFRFFIHSGLRAEERAWFDLDAREQGSFQHEVLAQFHDQLSAEGKRWREVTPMEARERVGNIARALSTTFRNGLLESSQQTRFTARVMTESLQDFVETVVIWMREQYQFDPVRVEFPFGEEGGPPAWSLELAEGRRLELHGRIDRVDLYRPGEAETAWCVVVDYKSSQKQLDPVLIEHGIQLQLLTYLNVLREWPNPLATLGVSRFEPAGVFYVSLRGKYGREPNRRAALADPQAARKLAYRHTGRFDARALPYLDSRPGVTEGDQFNYRLTRSGALHKRCKEPVPAKALEALLDQIEANLRSMGRQIYAGRAEVAPFRKGILTACDQCAYQAVCRFDPWTQSYRVLRAARPDEPAPAP